MSDQQSSAFWQQFGMLPKENAFDKHFEDPDLQLTQLLDDDLIIGEFKNQNQKLMNYFQLAQMQQLVSYITNEPADASNPKRAFRYPFYSCELLCCEISKITDIFFPKPQPQEEEDEATTTNGAEVEIHDYKSPMFHELLSLLNNQNEVNPMLAGYFGKVFANIYRLRTEQVLSFVFHPQNQHIIVALIFQLQSRSIAEVISKLICIEKEYNTESYLPQRIQIIDTLIDKLHCEDNFEVPQNIQAIISELITKAYAVHLGGDLIQHLLNQEIQNKLCKLAVHKNSYVSLAALSIISQLLNLFYQDDIRQQDTDEQNALQLDYALCLQVFCHNLPDFIEYLAVPKPQLGQTKIKILECLTIGIRLPSQIIVDTLGKLDLFKVLNQLVVQHDQNNILHLNYHRLVITIIELKQQDLINNLLQQNRLIEFLIQITENQHSNPQNTKRKGYLGFVTKIAKFLEDFSTKNEQIAEFLNANNEKWQQFKAQFYLKAQQDSEVELGGYSREKIEVSEECKQDCFFNREEISKKFETFLADPEPQAEVTFVPAQIEENPDIFKQFQLPAETTDPFNAFSFNNQQFVEQTVVTWDNQIPQPIQQEEPEEINQELIHFWKIDSDKHIEDKAFAEFDENL